MRRHAARWLGWLADPCLHLFAFAAALYWLATTFPPQEGPP